MKLETLTPCKSITLSITVGAHSPASGGHLLCRKFKRPWPGSKYNSLPNRLPGSGPLETQPLRSLPTHHSHWLTPSHTLSITSGLSITRCECSTQCNGLSESVTDGCSSVTVVNFVGLIYVTIIAFVTVVSTSCAQIAVVRY